MSAQLGRKEHWKGSIAIMESMLEDRLRNPEPKLLTISMRSVFLPLGSRVQSSTGFER